MSKWTIMNASLWISGKPSVEKIIKENTNEGIITVALKGGKPIFILGSGKSAYGKDGEKVSYQLDTGSKNIQKYDSIEIQNSITISEIEVISAGNGIGLNERRPLYVFK